MTNEIPDLTKQSALLRLEYPTPEHRKITWAQLRGSAYGLAISQAMQQSRLLVVITDDAAGALKLEQEIRFYTDNKTGILHFPDWESLPYDHFSPHEDIVSQRLETLYSLSQQCGGVLLTSIPTLMMRLAPPDFLLQNCFFLKVGQQLEIEPFRTRLEQSGYRYVSQVEEHGEFTVRGSIVDLYPMGSKKPFRIDLFDDEIESIRLFDPDTQRTTEQTESIRLIPGREFPVSEQAILGFRTRYRQNIEGDPNNSVIYRDVSQGVIPAGTEYYLPLFFEQTATLFDYLPEDALLMVDRDYMDAAHRFRNQVEQRYEQRRHDITRPILPPEQLFLSPDTVHDSLENFRLIQLQHFESEETELRDTGETIVNCETRSPPTLLVQQKAADPLFAFKEFVSGYNGQIGLVAESTGRREFILDLLRPHKLLPKQFDCWSEFVDSHEQLAILVAPLEQGLQLETPELCLIAEPQLFGTRAHHHYRRKHQYPDQENVIQSLTDLNIGAPVVHLEHGVGRYLGLSSLAITDQPTEFLTLEYADGDKLYVPVSSLHLISRYTGASPENAPLHKLGSDQWSRIKRKASKRVNDIAAQLLDLYSRRAAQKGHAYHINEHDYQGFSAAFPFEETPDQQTAIDNVITDMASEQPMDRVVCGDVGFGKTEVAMRAAFIAVQDGQQVALLVPTTLLAQQHYQNFLDRFADWPVRVEVLSRFKSKKETDTILSELATGKIDIIIGTHKLIQKDIRFDNLGLMILDEEHRFGVQQKENLKKMRAQVDVLTMTATPIPRTLNMALSGMRDLSIIATPPVQRVAIKTFVNQWNDTLIQEAVLREIKRGGQVYFLHNKVKTIEKTADKLRELIPEAEIRVAHGQMRERDLEQVMLDFYHQRFNVLVCSTIIESGIDIPTANTIIIDRADLFGLAQLHQLRGRVGRSHHRAYAYLLVPERGVMTPDAIKRLEAIESLEDLGSGFMLATHDLEIRGAGELLGEEQSGQIQEIGFSLYMELLERAIKSIREGKTPDVDAPLDTGPEIELNVPALIDEEYLPDIHARLILYKRIANAVDEDALRELQVEMIDRFGLLTDNIKTLFHVTELKLLADRVGVRKITANDQGARILFTDEPKIDHVAIIRLIQSQPEVYKLEGQDKLRIIKDLSDRQDRFDVIEKLLDSIRADCDN